MKGLMLVLSLGSVMAVSGACDGDDNPFSPEDVATVEITTAPPVLEAGSSVQLAFEVRDTDGNLIDPDDVSIDFSSSTATVATVSEAGLVTSVGPGTATITIEIGLVTDTIAVTVVPEISSLEIADAELNLITGETFGLDLSVLDAEGDPVTDPVLTFTSSNVTIVSVDDNGNVTGESEGSATITVEGGGESDTIEIEVFAAASQGIGFALGNSFTVQDGDELVLDDIASGPFVEAIPGAELEFTSTDPDVATVDASGVLVAHAAGEALITVTSPDLPGGSATMRLKVLEAGSVDVFEMEQLTAPIDFEEVFGLTLNVQVDVDGVQIEDFLPRFSSSDETVAVVFAGEGDNGIFAYVRVEGPGIATITAETGALTAESVITVE